jgi:hypothetical protein
MQRLALLLFCVAAAASVRTASAFTFADGTAGQCIAQGQVVAEVVAVPGDPAMQGRTGHAARDGDGWRITWSAARLAQLPPELHDFIFFHECAHARVPTAIELEANCAGLKDMRAAGRAGFGFEARLRNQVDMRHPYWIATFKCADEERPREAPAVPKG